MARLPRRTRLQMQIHEQQAWIERCGGSLAGYIHNYGDPGVPPCDENGESRTFVCPEDLAVALSLVPVPNKPGSYFMPHSGNGGTAIWEADTSHLRGLENELRLCRL